LGRVLWMEREGMYYVTKRLLPKYEYKNYNNRGVGCVLMWNRLWWCW